MIYNLTFILLLAPSLLSILEGCGRIPTRPKPTTPAPPTIPTQPSVNGSVRALECTEHEAQETACLNGGTCYVLVIQNKRVAECHCTEKYMGTRCQELNIDMFFPTTDGGHLATAGIAASAAVLILIVIVGVGVAIVYFRRRKFEKRQKQAEEAKMRRNGTLLPENHIQPPIKNRRYNGKDKHCELDDFESIPMTTSV